MIAFFTAGGMVQLVLSIFISVCALAYHTYALPYRESWLNMMQGACLFFIYLTLQAGLMVQNTLPDRITGDAILVALSVANIILLVSPFLMALIVGLQILPESIRRRMSVFFVGAAVIDTDLPKPAPSDNAPLDVDQWEATAVPSHLSVRATTDDDIAHIELMELSADALQQVDPDAWDDDPLFGAGAGILVPPSAVELAAAPSSSATSA